MKIKHGFIGAWSIGLAAALLRAVQYITVIDKEGYYTKGGLSSFLGGMLIGLMAIGVLFDKFGLRPTLLVCAVAGTVCIAAMASVNSTTAYLYSFVFPFALPLETIMLPLIATELFGRKSYATLMGLTVSFNTLGYAVGTPLMNLCYDLTGTYSGVMLVMCGVMVVVAVVMQFVITAAHRERERVEQEA